MASKMKPRQGQTHSLHDLKRLPVVEPEDDFTRAMRAVRPQTRGECVDGPRPCPWVSCRHHLYLDVNRETGSLNLPFPKLDPDELRETCSLDVADQSELTLEEAGAIMGVTRERVRQIEARALRKLGGRGNELEVFYAPDDDPIL